MARKRQALRRNTPSVALTIAGSDSSAGAGIQADLKTFSALGVYGLSAVTCIVAETPGKVLRIEGADPELVRLQIELLLNSFPVAAIKTGLLCHSSVIAMVARTLRAFQDKRSIPVVVDPVMIATTGDPLLDPNAIDVYERELFPLATLITPNLDEASRLIRGPIRNLAEMHGAAAALAAKYGVAVLLKGGHLRRPHATDVLHVGTSTKEFSSARVTGVATHGTGCTYSAAITAELAKNTDLSTAVRTGKRFISAAIRHHFAWEYNRRQVAALNHSPTSAR